MQINESKGRMAMIFFGDFFFFVKKKFNNLIKYIFLNV
jgi:hypothetical protein